MNGVEWLAYYDLFAPLNSGEDIYGKYTVVANKYDEWCAVPSSGGNEYGDTPSFFATDFTDDDYYNAAYYVVSGSVVIAKDGITIDAVSYNGSKIKGSYVGEVVVETGASQYVKSEEYFLCLLLDFLRSNEGNSCGVSVRPLRQESQV